MSARGHEVNQKFQIILYANCHTLINQEVLIVKNIARTVVLMVLPQKKLPHITKLDEFVLS